jgi:tetratricopeptide (TPR) repeat protein
MTGGVCPGRSMVLNYFLIIMVRVSLLFLLAVLSLTVQGRETSGREDNSVDRVRSWFEWGEYDSIVAYVPSHLDGIEDSVDLARLHLYLGVARFAAGRIGEARREFDRALAYNPRIILDRKYVSEEVVNLFDATVEERKRRLVEQARQDSLFRVKQRQLERETAVADSLEHLERARVHGRRRVRIAGAVGAGVMSGAFAALTVFEYREAEEAYRHFITAARHGDKARFEHYRELVRRGDALAVVSAILSMMSAVTSVGLTVRAHRLKAMSEEAGNSRGGGYAIRIVFEL